MEGGCCYTQDCGLLCQEGKGEEAGQVCDGGGLVMKTHHPGGRLGGAKLGPASGVVGSAMVEVCDVFALCRCGVRARKQVEVGRAE